MSEFRIESNPGWNESGRGQHPAEIHFILTGSKGAFVWQLTTGIGPAGPYHSADENGPLLSGVNLSSPMSMGVFAHSELTVQNHGEGSIHDNCEYLEGRACVGDYAHFSDQECVKAFATEGFDGVQRVLEAKYLKHYGEPA